jgi:hypothetical protein
MNRMAGVALASAGIGGLGGLAIHASGGFISKQAELESYTKKGMMPPPELVEAAKQEQMAMMGYAGTMMM